MESKNMLVSMLSVTLTMMLPACSGTSAINVVPGQWNPNYGACLGISFDRPALIERSYFHLSCRCDSPAFWRLCQKAMARAIDADYFIVVEQMPEQVLSEYWFILVVAKQGGAVLYTGGTEPLGQIYLGAENGSNRDGMGIASVLRRAKSGWDLSADHPVRMQQLARVLKVMDEAGVWEDQPKPYASDDVQMFGQPPIMLHIYRRSDGRSVDFLIADPVVTPAAITGQFEVGVLDDPGQAAGLDYGRATLRETNPGGQDAREELFHRSLPGRIVLNGALKLLYETMRGK